MKKPLEICAVIALALSITALVSAQTDPFLGTWKLNVQKSKFAPGPARKSESRIVTPGPMGMKVSIKRVNADASTQEFEYTTNLDGKSYPIIGDGPEGADSIAVNLTAPGTMQSTLTKAGKAVSTATISVSTDGKVLTIKSTGKQTDGKQFNNVAVYDKQ